MKGVERPGRNDFKPTQAAGTLFSEPNEIQFGDVFLDDAWTKWGDKYTILATTNDGKEIAFATLEYGEGMYPHHKPPKRNECQYLYQLPDNREPNLFCR